MVSEVNGRGIGGVTPLDTRGTKISGSRATDAASAARGQAAEVVTLTDLAARLQALTQSVRDLPVADRERIEQFRDAVADGSYEIDSSAVAEKLSAFEAMLAELAPAG